MRHVPVCGQDVPLLVDRKMDWLKATPSGGLYHLPQSGSRMIVIAIQVKHSRAHNGSGRVELLGVVCAQANCNSFLRCSVYIEKG